MTVAVKSTPETRASSPFDRLPVACAIGVIYVLASIAIIVKGLPALVWSWLGLSEQSFPAWFLLIAGMLAALALLVYLGTRLAGPNPPRGLRAGIFVALLGVGIIGLITRWAGAMFEHWSLSRHWIAEVGIGLTAAVGLLLLLVAGWFFCRPGFQAFLRRFEDQGWFSAASYKPNQGLRVRRWTTAGILALAGCGIYVYMNKLQSGPRDWTIELPFTGLVSVRDPGDVERAGIDVNFRGQVVILDPGDWPGFKAQQYVSKREFDEVVGNKKDNVEGKLENTVKIREVDAGRFDREGFVNRDALIVNKETFDAVQNTSRVALVSFPVKMPKAAPVLDRSELQNVNKRLESDYVRITKASEFDPFKVDDVVPTSEFDKVTEGHLDESNRLEDEANKLKEKGDSFAAQPLLEKAQRIKQLLPTSSAPEPMDGDTRHNSMTLVPHVRFVVPLLLLAGVIWLAWRIVNLPTFADFLIATDAELNKVSWTPRKRLVQDTIVVLVATLLITLYLLFADVVWSWLLTRVGVLRMSDKDRSGEIRPDEDQPW
jgi:preprotein translocase SecE subunit